jgi:heme A synthase
MVLFVIVTGAGVTSGHVAFSNSAVFSASGHRAAGAGAGVLVAVLVGWLLVVDKRPWSRGIGLMTLAALGAEIGLGAAAGPASPPASSPVSSMAAMAHAFLAPMLLSGVAAMALAASRGWRREPVMIAEKGWPSMGGLARTTLIFVVLQVALGTAFRHGAMGVMAHITGALVVVVLILTLVVCLTQLAEHPVLRPAAITLLVLVFLQVFLGLTLLSMGSKTAGKLPAVIFGMTHVGLGAAALAVSVIVALEARRSVRQQVP